MAIYYTEEIREMSEAEIENELEALQSELLEEKSILAAGGAPQNPGRIQELRKTIARIKTIKREKELGLDRGEDLL